MFQGAPVSSLEAGRCLFRQGDEVNAYYRLVEGQCVLQRQSLGGAMIVMRRVMPGAIVAEASLFAERYRCDCVAEQPSVVQRLGLCDALEALWRQPNLAIALLREMSGNLHAARSLLEIRDTRRADDRCLAHLEWHATGGVVYLAAPLRRFAQEIGLTDEAYYRALASLARRGLIARTPDSIHLLNRKAVQ